MKNIILLGLFCGIVACSESNEPKIGKVERTNNLKASADTLSTDAFSFDSTYRISDHEGKSYKMNFKADSIFIELGNFWDKGTFYITGNILCFTMKSQGWEHCFERTGKQLSNQRQTLNITEIN